MRKTDTDTDQIWGELSGQLDEVVARLNGSDRRAVLLRFYESKTYGEVGAVLGISEEAARKRVERAVDKLQGMFQRRGISFSSGAIGAAMMIARCAERRRGGCRDDIGCERGAVGGVGNVRGAAAKTAGGMIAFAQAKAAAIVIGAAVAIAAAGGTAVVIAKAKSAKPQAANATVFAAPVAVATSAPSNAQRRRLRSSRRDRFFLPMKSRLGGAVDAGGV